MIVVGASLGGLRAVRSLLSGLPKSFSSPMAIVLHRAKDTPDLLASVLQPHTHLRVVEAMDKDPIEIGCVYVAPPDYHLLVDRDGLSLSVDEPVNYARPSIDVLFQSAAGVFGKNAIAILLTGSNADGAAGAAAIAARGGTVVVQDPKSAESPVMPASALERISTAKVLSLAQIAPFLVETLAPSSRAHGY